MLRFSFSQDHYRYTYQKTEQTPCYERVETVSLDLNSDPQRPGILRCVSSSLVETRYAGCNECCPAGSIERIRTQFEGPLQLLDPP